MDPAIETFPSPLGEITLAADSFGLRGLWFAGQRHFMQGISDLPDAQQASAFPDSRDVRARDPREILRLTQRWLRVYFEAGNPDFTPPLAPRGTPFRLAVWRELMAVPYGETRSYAEVAKALGQHSPFLNASPRAVGGAVGHNPISLIIPCHRIIAAGGGLTGYAGGLSRKRALLDMERLHGGSAV